MRRGNAVRSVSGARRRSLHLGWLGVFPPGVLAALTAATALGSWAASPPRLVAERLPDPTGIRLVVQGEPGRPIHLESSSNLTDWITLETFPNPTGTSSYDDPASSAWSARFFRARESAPPVVSVPPPFVPGGTVDLNLEWAPEPADEILLRWAGEEVEWIDRADGRLRIRLSTNTVSGRLTWIDGHGAQTLPGRWIVAADSTLRLQVPPGLDASRFRWINAYGTAAATTTNATVRRGHPLLHFVVPVDPGSSAFFLAFSLDDRETTTLGAMSTAAALVFLSPVFYTDDVAQARRFLATAAANGKVTELATAIAAAVEAGLDPLTAPEVVRIHQEALASLLGAAAAAGPGGTVTSPGLHGAPAPALALDQFDLENIAIRSEAGVLNVRPAPGNHLEWVVSARRIDVDRAFPRGRFDYRAVLLGAIAPGQSEYPTVSGFERRFLVESALWLDNIDLAGLAGKYARELFFGASPDPAGRFELPSEPGLYVLRAVSPAWNPAAEYDFVQREYHETYLASVRANLLAAAADLVSAASPIPGTGAALDKAAETIERALTGLDTLPPMRNPGDFLERVASLAASLAEGIGFADLAGASPTGAEAAERASGLFGRVLREVGKATKDAFEWGDKLVDTGKALERAYGLLDASPLESAFVEVGDPFHLAILAVDPAAGSAGDLIRIVLEGRRYGTSPNTDGVAFADGGVPVPSDVIEVRDLPDHRQELRLAVPLPVAEFLEPLIGTNGAIERTLVVTAGGRRGVAPFRYVDRPTVTGLEPREGFAAVPDFLGSPFPGTPVRLRGFGFGPEDHYFFGSAEATDPSGSTGDVTVHVPAGAASGPIRIVPEPALPEGKTGESPAFRVLGAPALGSHGPVTGPIGTTVEALADGLGAGPATMTLAGSPLSQVRLFDRRIAGVVPLGASSGTLQIVTPAGSAGFEFTVEAGLSPGALIEVGESSVVTLARAVELAAYPDGPLWIKGCTPSPTCIDDEDIERDENGNPLRGLDPPAPGQVFEEGDFLTDRGIETVPRFPVGRAYADTLAITGTIAGQLTLEAVIRGDTLLAAGGMPATIQGDVVLRGKGHRLVNLIIHGHLQVEGDENQLEGIVVTRSEGPGVTIKGNGNRIQVQCVSNTYDGLIVDGGRFNEVDVLSTANGGNGVTLTRGAHGNRLSMSTGFLPTPGGLVPWRGNGAHGLAILAAASGNIVVGTTPIARNSADGAYLSGPGVVSNRLEIFHALANGGSGFNLRDGATGNRLEVVLSESNGDSGVEIRGCPATRLRQVHAFDNGGSGIRLIGLDRPDGAFEFDCRQNRGAGLRLEDGTAGIVATGVSTSDAVGVELRDPATTRNQVSARIVAARTAGALVEQATRNTLALRIRGSAGLGLRVSHGARENEFPALQVNDCGGDGVLVTGAGTAGNRFPDPRIGLPFEGENPGNAGDGIRVEDRAAANQFGAPDGRGPEIRDNGGVGLRFLGPADSPNLVLHPRIEEDPAVGRIQTRGLVLEAGVAGMLIDDATLVGHPDAGLDIVDSPRNDCGAFDKTGVGNRLVRNGTGLRLRGPATVDCRIAGNSLVQNGTGLVLEDGARGNRLGGGNLIGDNAVGIRVEAAPHNRIERNVVRDNAGPGILVLGGATNVLIFTNTVTRNDVGVQISGPGTVANRIALNSITENRGKGIRLTDGGNREIPPPVVESVGSQRVFGSAWVEDGSKVELFSDSFDEGARFLGSALVIRGTWSVEIDLRPADVGRRFRLHATVTDPDRDSSEFGDVEGFGPLAPLLCVSTRDGNAELYRLDGPWSEATRLTAQPADDRNPALSPSGAEVAFVSDRDGNRDIHLLALGGTNPVSRLTTDSADDYDPAWRWDGAALVFVSERTGNPDLHRINADGTGTVALTTNPAADRWPSYSPDGTRLVFASERGGAWDLWIAGADGADPQPLTKHPASDTRPRWSPDGTRIAFVSDRDDNPEIYTIRPDGTDLRRLTDHPAVDTEPAWLDEGTVVFASNREGAFELYETGPAGETPRRLTFGLGDNREPSRSP